MKGSEQKCLNHRKTVRKENIVHSWKGFRICYNMARLELARTHVMQDEIMLQDTEVKKIFTSQHHIHIYNYKFKQCYSTFWLSFNAYRITQLDFVLQISFYC